MTIDNLRTPLDPSANIRTRCELDERVDTTEPVAIPKPPEPVKCIVTSFCPSCGHRLECVECQGPMPTHCTFCLSNTPKPLVQFGEAVQ